MRCSILVVLFCLFSISVRSNVTYEVRPDGKGLQSLIGAKEEIEVRLKNGEIEDYTVILDEGVYYLEHPLVFSENYSLPNGSVTFTGKSGEVPVISGGNDDLSWEYYEHMAGVVKANVDINVRNLWIGGKRMRRAQGYVGYALGIFNEMVDGVDLKGLLFSKEDFPSFTDISGLEIKFYNYWRSYYFKVESIHDINSISTIPENQVLVVIDNFDVALTQIPDMNWIGVGEKNPYFFENALEFLDEPGEFCYTPSDQTLYYCLKDDESPNNIDAVIPNLQNIISVKSNDKVVENLFFQGLEFSHCDWTWTSQNGFIPLQSSVYFTGTEKWDGFITAAIQVEDARSVKFESCKFTRLSTNGIHIKNNVDGICTIVR